MNLNFKKTAILVIVIVAIFFFIYSPHFSYKFPIHIDEYKHITETLKLKNGIITEGLISVELGFNIFLLPFSYMTNLVLIYQFFPAIWALISALVLFILVYKKTNSFAVSIFSMIFFASIKSNMNLSGLWFFTPLTFSIPFIYLYIYLFTEGIQKQNKKMILASLIIMFLLIFIHSISALFSIPFLLIYSVLNHKYIIREYKFFAVFLIIPVSGILFFSLITSQGIINSVLNILEGLQFKKGWGVLELDNSPYEIYSFIGYVLALIGIISIFIHKKQKDYLVYLLWPLAVLISIFIFKQTGISYLSPYQRNIYYFAISLPILSACGLDFLVQKIKLKNEKVKKIAVLLFLLLIIYLTFNFYFKIPQDLKPVKIINNEEYDALVFLSSLSKQPDSSSKVMAPVDISTALYPIANQEPVGTIYFYGNKEDVQTFFKTEDCKEKNNLLKKNNAIYIISKNKIDCNWKEIYNKNDVFIYRVF